MSRLWGAEFEDRITVEREELPDTNIWDDQELKRQNRLCREFKCSLWLPQERIIIVAVFNLINIWLLSFVPYLIQSFLSLDEVKVSIPKLRPREKWHSQGTG